VEAPYHLSIHLMLLISSSSAIKLSFRTYCYQKTMPNPRRDNNVHLSDDHDLSEEEENHSRSTTRTIRTQMIDNPNTMLPPAPNFHPPPNAAQALANPYSRINGAHALIAAMSFLAIKYTNDSIALYRQLSNTMEKFIQQNPLFFPNDQIKEEFRNYILSEVSKSYQSWKTSLATTAVAAVPTAIGAHPTSNQQTLVSTTLNPVTVATQHNAHPTIVPANASIGEESTRENSAASTATAAGRRAASTRKSAPKGDQGKRYADVPDCYITASSFEQAIEKFTLTYGCRSTRLPAELFRNSQRSPKTYHQQHHYEQQTYVCICQKLFYDTATKLRFESRGFESNVRQFAVQIHSDKMVFFREHFYLLETVTVGNNIPLHIKNTIRDNLHRDPYAEPNEILPALMRTNDAAIKQWLVSECLGKDTIVNELLEFIQFQSTTVKSLREAQDQSTLFSYQVPHGPSIQSVQWYCRLNSFTKFLKPIAPGHVFETLNEFVSYFGFPSRETILCIPTTEEDFTGTTFRQEQRESSSSCIIFTSPVHLWALHQQLASPLHNALSIFSMDGVYSLRVMRSGSQKTVIMSLGFLSLNVHNKSRPLVVTRAFVLCLHCLSPSENGPAAFLCLKGLSRIYESFFSRSLDVHCLSADASQAIAKGFSEAFPDKDIITDVEHLRSGPSKKWSKKINGGPETHARLSYWITLLSQSRSYTN
jgi:hypothetical protein